MKCAFCIADSMVGKNITRMEPIRKAVTKADEAVSIVKGRAICAEHLRQYLAESIKATIRDPLGR